MIRLPSIARLRADAELAAKDQAITELRRAILEWINTCAEQASALHRQELRLIDERTRAGLAERQVDGLLAELAQVRDELEAALYEATHGPFFVNEPIAYELVGEGDSGDVANALHDWMNRPAA